MKNPPKTRKMQDFLTFTANSSFVYAPYALQFGVPLRYINRIISRAVKVMPRRALGGHLEKTQNPIVNDRGTGSDPKKFSVFLELRENRRRYQKSNALCLVAN
jgi:hypothetical protein